MEERRKTWRIGRKEGGKERRSKGRRRKGRQNGGKDEKEGKENGRCD